ncbi:MAG: Xaa-Pro peptidase family protein [Duncaniella sp.]|nr:Xaa-Pro peptidase family protein [Duncaniella sp.]
MPADESDRRLNHVRALMSKASIGAMLVTDNANLYYLTGRVFAGYVYLPAEGPVIYFVRRPVELEGDGVVYIRKPEDITLTIGLNMPQTIGLELATESYASVMRLSKVFPGASLADASSVLRTARSVKTEYEIGMIRHSGVKHVHVYRQIPRLFQAGMTDIELQVEIEKLSRMEGCLGQFRISGSSMELYMGNLLVGDNADAPSPYDFAMGGAGSDPSLPVGADGTPIRRGNTVMVDMNGNYNGYMTDMTRVYALDEVKPLALKAHQCSIDIHKRLVEMMTPGTPAKTLWEEAEKMVKERDLHAYYMGHRQHAGFIGHGVGIEINELPVIAPRSRDLLAEGNVIALEPKFVIPGVGAVGIENTYAMLPDGKVECLTPAPEEIEYFLS